MELPGFPDPSIRDYEIRHGDLSAAGPLPKAWFC